MSQNRNAKPLDFTSANPGIHLSFRGANLGLNHFAEAAKRTQPQEKKRAPQRKPPKMARLCSTDSDALQQVLCLVLSQHKAGQVAATLLQEFGTFSRVLNAPTSSLMAIGNVGETEAGALKAVATTARRLLQSADANESIFKTSNFLKQYITDNLHHKKEGLYFIIYLDSCNHIVGDEALGQAVLEPREVIRRCLEMGAARIIIARNHPTGAPEPRLQDIELTEELVEAAGVFGITITDHLITGGNKTFSFYEGGLGSIMNRPEILYPARLGRF